MCYKNIGPDSVTHKYEAVEYPSFGLEGLWGEPATEAEFPVSRSNPVCFTPWLLLSSTPHSPQGFTQLKTGWAQDAWLQWSHENWYFHLDISLRLRYLLYTYITCINVELTTTTMMMIGYSSEIAPI